MPWGHATPADTAHSGTERKALIVERVLCGGIASTGFAPENEAIVGIPTIVLRFSLGEEPKDEPSDNVCVAILR